MGNPRVRPEALTQLCQEPEGSRHRRVYSIEWLVWSAHRSGDGAGRARARTAGAAAGRAARGEQIDIDAGAAEGGRDGELRCADAVLERGGGGELHD